MFNGLKARIFSILVGVLLLNTMMTFFVFNAFLRQDVIRHFGAGVERRLMGFLQSPLVSVRSAVGTQAGAEETPLLLQVTGATAGFVYDIERKKSFFLGSSDQHVNVRLEQLANQAVSMGTTQRELLKPIWGGLPVKNNYLLLAVPVTGNKWDGRQAVSLAVPLSSIYSTSPNIYKVIAVYLLVNLLLCAVIGFFRFVRFMVRPVEKLVRITDSFKEDDAIPLFFSKDGDEFGQLAHSLNRMLSRIKTDQKELQKHVVSLEAANAEIIETRNEMVRTEKLASVGRLAAGLAHEIGNPISVVQGYLGLLSQTDLNDGERKEFALRSEKELARIDQLVRQLLDYSRVNTGEQSEVSMHDLLDAMVAMLRSQPSMRDISFQFSFAAAEDTVLADPNQVQQVLLNCFFNAADALHVESSSSKLIKIETENIVDEDGSKKIRISLQDNGTGMNEDILANVFDPFFTTKEPGKGTGLGLSVAHSLIEGMGGTMRLESKSGAGTVVIFVLPLL